ncbi:MAG: DUF4296 domain-containing protein [Balneolaceae bacterium]
MRKTILSILLLIVVGCNSEPAPPEKMISEPEYQDLLVEVFMVQYMVELDELEEKRDSMMNALFDRYNLTSEEFSMIHQYYQRDPARQLERIDVIREKLANEREALQEAREAYLNRMRNRDESQPPDSL